MITKGRTTINKQHFYLQDDWKINVRTVLTLSLHLDHSNHFNTNMTFNLGATQNLHGNRNTRLKANIGSDYAEPGLAELYYNWEMFEAILICGSLLGSTSRLGWY